MTVLVLGMGPIALQSITLHYTITPFLITNYAMLKTIFLFQKAVSVTLLSLPIYGTNLFALQCPVEEPKEGSQAEAIHVVDLAQVTDDEV